MEEEVRERGRVKKWGGEEGCGEGWTGGEGICTHSNSTTRTKGYTHGVEC